VNDFSRDLSALTEPAEKFLVGVLRCGHTRFDLA
jgi:hypothetical protein